MWIQTRGVTMRSWMGYIAAGLCAILVCYVGDAQGTCKVDEIPVMENFDMTQMMGVWYETHWAPPYFEKPEEVWYDYVEVWSETEEPERVAVKAYGRPVNGGSCDSFNKSYRKSEGEESAKWWSPRYINSSYSFPMDQWFIGTNYESWALVYSCIVINADSGECDEVAAWVWSSDQTLSPEDRGEVSSLLPNVCLTFEDFNEMPVGEECERPSVTGSASLLKAAASMICLLLSIQYGFSYGLPLR